MNQANISRRNATYTVVALGSATCTWHDKATGETVWARAMCADGKRRLVKALKSRRWRDGQPVTEFVCRVAGQQVFGYIELKKGKFPTNTVHFTEF